MEALQFTLKDNKLEYVKKPIPVISDPCDVLVKVAYSGICGTDLHIIQGEYPCNGVGAFTLGHETCGIIVAVGSQVVSLKKGDKVAIDPNRSCGFCEQCRSANPQYCVTHGNIPGMNNTLGIFKNGGWAEFVLAPQVQVYKIPDMVSMEQAALAEPISCVAHGWDRISPVLVGQKILITGAGIIGNLWAAVLHLQGHRNVVISEPNSIRRQLVQKLNTGFDILTPQELQHRFRDPLYLFDLIIDCSGFPPAIEQALSLLNSGGKLCIFGVAPPSDKISIAPYEIYKKELKIVGVNINPFSFNNSLGLITSMGNRYLDYDSLGIKVFSLKNYKEAFEELKMGSIAKAVFKL